MKAYVLNPGTRAVIGHISGQSHIKTGDLIDFSFTQGGEVQTGFVTGSQKWANHNTKELIVVNDVSQNKNWEIFYYEDYRVTVSHLAKKRGWDNFGYVEKAISYDYKKQKYKQPIHFTVQKEMTGWSLWAWNQFGEQLQTEDFFANLDFLEAMKSNIAYAWEAYEMGKEEHGIIYALQNGISPGTRA